MREGLNGRNNPEVPTEFLTKLMEIILKNNIFNFHDEMWRQEVGCAMGSKPAPSYANIFMAKKIDDAIIIAAQEPQGT